MEDGFDPYYQKILALIGKFIAHQNHAVGAGAGLADALGGSIGHKDHVIVSALLIGRTADIGFQHAHDGKSLTADLDGLADGVAAVGRTGNVIAHHADFFIVRDVHIGQAPALGQRAPHHIQVGLTHALDARIAIGGGIHLHGAVQRGGGRHAGEHLRMAVHDIVQLLHGHRAGAAARDLDTEDIGPHLRKAVLDALGHAIAQTHDDDDRHDTDDDAQHGQNGAEFVAPDILDCFAEGLVDHAFPSCSAGSKFSVG